MNPLKIGQRIFWILGDTFYDLKNYSSLGMYGKEESLEIYKKNGKRRRIAVFYDHCHWIIGWWRLKGSGGPTLCSEHEKLEQVAQKHVWWAFEYFQRWTLNSLSGQAVPGFDHPHNEKAFSYPHVEFPVFRFVPVASCPVTGYHCEDSGPTFFSASHQTLKHIDKVSAKPFFFLRLNNPNS